MHTLHDILHKTTSRHPYNLPSHVLFHFPHKSSTSSRQKHVKFAVKWLPPRRVVTTCFIVICRAKIPTGGSSYLALFRPASFNGICLSFGLVAPCALCLGLYTTCSSGTFVTVYSVNSCWLHIVSFKSKCINPCVDVKLGDIMIGAFYVYVLRPKSPDEK